MATVNEQLSVDELEERYVACSNGTASRHFQAIWLLARGHTVAQVSATTAFGERWIEQLLERYNSEGPDALGDLRRRNGAVATILKLELLAKLGDRLVEPPPDGGVWSSRKVANFMAVELGLATVAPQRGWRAESRAAGPSEAFRGSGLSGAAKVRQALKAIGWSIQAPRPKNPKSATAEETAAFKKTRRRPRPGRLRSILASQSRSSQSRSSPRDEHRIGLKPVTRPVWAPVGERPIAHGDHRFDWLYGTAFASPATGETFWYLSNGVSKPFFEALLETFAREAEAGLGRIILLVLDKAGWYGAAGLKIPDGIRLSFICRPTAHSYNQPKPCGRSSTSRSSTSTLQQSRNSKRKSPTNASPSPSIPSKSKHEPVSIGGQSGSFRANPPETV